MDSSTRVVKLFIKNRGWYTDGDTIRVPLMGKIV